MIFVLDLVSHWSFFKVTSLPTRTLTSARATLARTQRATKTAFIFIQKKTTNNQSFKKKKGKKRRKNLSDMFAVDRANNIILLLLKMNNVNWR